MTRHDPIKHVAAVNAAPARPRPVIGLADFPTDQTAAARAQVIATIETALAEPQPAQVKKAA